MRPASTDDSPQGDTMKVIAFLLAACAGVASLSVSAADAYPTKPITMLVPAALSGSTDSMARQVVEHLAAALGQPLVVDNKAGASGIIGTEAVARATPDGYTLSTQYSGYHVGNPSL